MIFFGHLGLTLAAAGGAGRGLKRIGKDIPALDFRAVLIGSILPDLIDKPLAFIFRDAFLGASRLYAHTLLFSAFMIGLGIYLWKRHKNQWGLLLAGGCVFHQILDGMWNSPVTLFWPFLGLSFPPKTQHNLLLYIIYELMHDPYLYIPEIAGLTVIVYFTALLVRKKQLIRFIKSGLLL